MPASSPLRDRLSWRLAAAVLALTLLTWGEAGGRPALALPLTLALFGGAYVVHASQRRLATTARELDAVRELNRVLVAHAPVGIAIYDETGQCVSANQAMADYAGGPLDALLQLNFHRLESWRRCGFYRAALAAQASGAPQSLVDRLVTSFGREAWFSATFTPLRHGDRHHLMLLLADLTEARQTQADLAASERRYRDLYDSIRDGIALVGPDGRLAECNAAFAAMTGYGEDELRGAPIEALTPAQWRAADAAIHAGQVLSRGYSDEYEKEYRRQDGTLIAVSLRLWQARDGDGRTLGTWNMVRDITERKAAERQQRLALQVFDHSSEAILVSDRDNHIVSVNSAFETITGYRFDEVRGCDPHVLSSGIHDEAFYRAMWQAINATGCWEGELWDRRKSGEVYPKWLRITAIHDQASGEVGNYVAIFSDISDRKHAEQQIHYLAHHDALTSLPNRLSLQNRLEQAIRMAHRESSGLAVMFIDLDRFKNINDSLGHHVGDQLLIEVARRLDSSVRQSDLVARLGGDEFVVVMHGLETATDAAPVAKKILERLAQPCAIDGQTLHPSSSIGISVFPDDGGDIESLMRNADTAMYFAKNRGRGNYQFYAAHMNEAAAEQLALENSLRLALAYEHFVLHFQPQIHLASGALDGFEALLRWQDPERGLVPPAAFIPVAEETGVIVGIGEWVLRQACHQAKAWRAAGLRFGTVAVNISPQQFRRDDFFAVVRDVLSETGVDPTCIELEITEGTVMETADASVEVLRQLRGLGLALAIDDFGTGYSSLSYLRAFPIRRLKIDRSFVLDIERDPNDAAIAAAVIALAKSINLAVVAEGAETPGQLAFLRAHGCEFVQGYLFSPPLPAAAAADYARGLRAEGGTTT